MRMSAKAFQKGYGGSQKKSKYNNRKTEVDGKMFDSKKEATRYSELCLLERLGKIKNLQTQVSFVLVPKNKNGRQIKYIADFVYWDTEKSKEVIEDSKGMLTPVYKLKKRLMAELGHEIVET